MNNTRATSLDEALYVMAHNSQVSIREASEAIGVKSPYLYRMLNPYDSGANLPAPWLIKAMQSFKNILPFRVQANYLGFLIVKPPFGRASKARSLSEFQLQFSKLIQTLIDFSNHPLKDTRRGVLDLLREHMETTAHLRARCEKDLNQMELNF